MCDVPVQTGLLELLIPWPCQGRLGRKSMLPHYGMFRWVPWGSKKLYKGRGPHLLKTLMLIWHRSWTPVFLGLHHKGQDGYGERLGFAIK